ncbi:MAG: lipopolysaccharide biosynthesis protein [Steroidobacteraceae bacterium]
MSLYTRSQARRSLIDTVSYRAVSQLATILGYIVLVRAMTKEDFGVFNLLYAFIPVLSTVASLGLEQTLRRYQPEYLRSGRKAAAAWLVRFAASARFGMNVMLLSLILLGWNYVAPLFKLTPYRGEFVIFSFLMLVHFQARILEISLAAHMLQRYSVGAMAVVAVVKLLAYCTLWWQGIFTLTNAIVADTAAFAIAYVFMLRAYRRYCAPGDRIESFRPDRAERQRLLRYGFFNNFNDAGTLVLSGQSDSFFIAAIIDPVSVGIYAFYMRLNDMAHSLLPVQLFENVIQPLFFAVPRSEADQKVPRYFSLLLNLNLLIQWPVLAYATAYHAEIVQVIFGGKFLEHSWLLPVAVAFATFNVIAVPVTLVAQYEEKVDIILWSKIFGIYNIIALLALLPVAGVYGAAIASGSAQAMKNGYIWWHVRNRARWINAGTAMLFSVALWGSIVAVCILLKSVSGAAAVVHLFVGALLVGLGCLAHLRGPALSITDREILEAILGGKEAAILRRIGLLARS